MEPKSVTHSFRFEDPRKARIYDQLSLISPAAASFYSDACRLMETHPPFVATTHLVAHLIREIESSLRWALEPYKSRSTEDSRRKIGAEEGTSFLAKAGIPKSDPVAKAWLDFIDTLDPDQKHKEDIKALLKGLEIPENDPVAVAWLRLARSFHGWAHRDNLETARAMDDEFREFWAEITDIFSVVLEKLASQYLNSFDYLDQLLSKEKPTKKDVKSLRLNVPNNSTTYGYFFHWLNNPAWLPLLRAQKLFARPLQPIYEPQDEGYLVSYPYWPQSRYLVRMAASSHETVQQIVLEIALSIETENISIHQDLLDIARALPAARAATLAKYESTWITNQAQLGGLLPERLGELIAHLSDGNQAKAAIELARSALGVLPNPRADEDKDGLGSWHREPVSRLGGWYYGRVLQLGLSPLVKAGGFETVEMFCDLLETAVNLHQGHAPVEDTDDFSDTWRTAVEHRSHDNAKDYLVSAVLKSIEQIAKEDSEQVPALLNLLEGRSWRIFKRLSLHLIRVAPQHAADLITERLADPQNQNPPLSNEYMSLLRDHINKLNQEKRDQILARLSAGPTLAAVKERHEFFVGRTLTDDEADKAVKRERAHHLMPLRDVLPEEWKRRYDQWVQDATEPLAMEQERIVINQTGSTKILESKSVSDLINVLATQSQSTANLNPRPAKLAAELRALVEAEPEGLGKRAGAFKVLGPTYLHSFLAGFLDAVQRGKPIPWQQILTLCHWVLKQPKEHNQNEDEGIGNEKSLMGARSVIARLLAAGLKESNSEIPFKLRNSAWRLLKPFTEDPEPTPQEEQTWEASSDLSGHALSTVRGNAMHTVMYYALWVQRHLMEEANGHECLVNGFDEMPEVRKILEFHLNPGKDPSLAIRSVYGHWLPNFVILDENWLKSNLSRIFPSSEHERGLRLAAWGAYLRAWDVYKNIFNALQEEYGRAIERIGEAQSDGQHSDTLNQRLAHHLIRSYGFGNLALDDPEGLLTRFYAKAPDSLCSHILWHVGYTFHESKEDVHPVVLQRFQKLWEKRLSVARLEPQSHIREMTAFGNLFYSEKFDDGWAITELKNALEISKWAEPALFVVQRLATLAPDYPDTAIQCLAYMVEGAKEEWALSSWGLPIRTIIAAARQSDAISKHAATELVHRLGARGHTEFRDLL